MAVRVRLPGGVDVPASLEVFRRWGDDGIDRWDGSVLMRTLPGGVTFTARWVGDAFEVDPPAAAGFVERLFLGDAAALAQLVAGDPAVARAAAAHPGLRPVRWPDLFLTLLRSISAQQINLTFAATLRRRLAEAYGRRVSIGSYECWALDAATVAGAEVADLRAMQFSTRKAEYIVGAAEAVAAGRISLDELAELDIERAIGRLVELRGIGRWSAEWILLRCLDRPVVAAGDLGVRKAVGAAYLDGEMPSEQQVRALTAHWGAAAPIAQQLLLASLPS